MFVLADKLGQANGDPEALDAIIKTELSGELLNSPKLYAEAIAKLTKAALATTTIPGAFERWFRNEYIGGGDAAELYMEAKAPQVLAILERFNGYNGKSDERYVKYYVWRAATVGVSLAVAESMTPAVGPESIPLRYSVNIESKIARVYKDPSGHVTSVTVKTATTDSFSDPEWVAKFTALRDAIMNERAFSGPSTVERQDHYNIVETNPKSGIPVPSTHLTTEYAEKRP